MIEFDPERRKKWAYRTDENRSNAKDQSSLDDDKTQSALRFVMRLDRALNFQDKDVHEMATYALHGLLTKGQFDHADSRRYGRREQRISQLFVWPTIRKRGHGRIKVTRSIGTKRR